MKNIISKLKNKFFNDKNTRDFIEHNYFIWKNDKRENSGNKVLVELCGLQHCIIAWSYFANALAEMHDASIYTYYGNVKIKDYATYDIYKSFNVDGCIVEKINKQDTKRKIKLLNNIFLGLKEKKDVLDINVDGINIGTEIYESYLIAGHPTVDINDTELKKLIDIGISKVIFWKKYLCSGTVKSIIISHDCYLGAIIRKLANHYNIPIYQITTNWGVKLAKDFTFGANFKYYKKFFNQLSTEKKTEGVNWAKTQLEKRFSGEIGVDMYYSKKSSFNPIISTTSKVLQENNKLKVLICTHCFFDNPYAYGKLLFTDFYEWLCFLGEMSNITDYDWYVKTHPDYRPGTIETLTSIVKRYPKLKIISPNIPHQQLVQEGIKFVLTVYGTVGCEYPLMGVQVVNAGCNPHEAYDFNWHPKTIEEYKEIILNLSTIDKKIDKEEVYQFYCVHHLYANYYSKLRGKDDLIFLSEENMRKVLKEDVYTSKIYKYFLNEFTVTRHESIKKNVKQYIESMNKYKNDDIGIGNI